MSAINTGSMNANYPEPGVNNSTQGFRDNFNSIKNNLDTASAEISDLQNKAVLKSALVGTVLDNDMNNTLISNALTKGFRGTTLNLGNDISGFVDIDFSKADVHFGTMTGDLNLKFVNWPKVGTHAKIQIIFRVDLAGLKITFPEAIDQSRLTLENRVISTAPTVTVEIPAGVEIVHYVLSTEDCGETLTIVPVNRPRKSTQIMDGVPTFNRVEYSGTISTLASSTDVNGTNCQFATELKVGKKLYDSANNEIGTIRTIFSNNYLRLEENAYKAVTNATYKSQLFIGAPGDKLGAIFASEDVMSVCVADYDGETEIWETISFNGGGTLAAVSSIQVTGGQTGLTFSPNAPIISYGEYVMGGTLNTTHGGTGATNLNGYVKAAGNNPYTAVEKIPAADLSGTVAVVNGGTGASAKDQGLINLLPDLLGNNSKVLGTDGVQVSWVDVQYNLPIASDIILGGVKVDGTSITVNNVTGVISATPYTLPVASNTVLGGIKIDGTTLTIDTTTSILSATQYQLPVASTSVLGGVKLDGTSITINEQGIISANLTTDYVLPVASNTVLGGVKVDGSSITIDTDGYIETPIATASQVGIVKPGSGLSISTDGALTVIADGCNVDEFAFATTSTRGVIIVGAGLSIDGSGVLSVAGAGAGGGGPGVGIRAGQGTPAATTGFAFNSDEDTGMFSVGSGANAGTLNFYTNGQEAVRIDASKNLSMPGGGNIQTTTLTAGSTTSTGTLIGNWGVGTGNSFKTTILTSGGANIGGTLIGQWTLGTGSTISGGSITPRIATATQLGGIKVGSGLAVTADGTLSASAQTKYDIFPTGSASPGPHTFPAQDVRGFSAYSSTDFPGTYYGGITVTGVASSAGNVYSGQMAFRWDTAPDDSTSAGAAPIGFYFRVNDDTGNQAQWSPWTKLLQEGDSLMPATNRDVGAISVIYGPANTVIAVDSLVTGAGGWTRGGSAAFQYHVSFDSPGGFVLYGTPVRFTYGSCGIKAAEPVSGTWKIISGAVVTSTILVDFSNSAVTQLSPEAGNYYGFIATRIA